MTEERSSRWGARALVGAVFLLVGLGVFTGVGSAAPDVVVDGGGDGIQCSNADATSIQSAIDDNATDGDVVEVCSGTYDESVTVNKSVSLVANTTGGDVVLNSSTSADAITVADGVGNVTVRGFRIRGYSGAGVSAQGTNSNVTVANNTISGSGPGVRIAPTGGVQRNWNVRENNVSVTTTGADAIAIRLTDDSTISSVDILRNTVTSRDADGIRITSTGPNAITGMSIQGNNISENKGNGIFFENVNGSYVVDNTIHSNNDGVKLISATGVRISNNSVQGGEISVTGGSSNNVAKNDISGDTYGVYIESSSTAAVLGNTVTSTFINGINVTSTNGTTLAGNTLTSNGGDGLVLHGATNSTVRDSVVEESGVTGILLEAGSDDNTLVNNTAKGNLDGVAIRGSDDNTVTNSTSTGNTDRGIELSRSSGNGLRAVTVLSNDNGGVVLEDRATDNRIEGADIRKNGGDGVALDGSSSGTVLADANVSANGDEGINVTATSDTLLRNVTALGNVGVAFHSGAGSTNTTAERFTLPTATVSFDGRDVEVTGTVSPPADPDGRASVGVHVDATGTSADSWLDVNVSYDESSLGAVSESSLALWKHNESGWTNASSGRNAAQNYVYANITTFSTLAPTGDVPGTPVSGCTTISTGGRYTLVQNVTDAVQRSCINITSSGVVFDGYGLTVDSDGSYSNDDRNRGINVSGDGPPLSNVTVRNVTVTDWERGVRFDGVVNSSVTDANATDTGIGYYIGTTGGLSDRNNTVGNSTALNNGQAGIAVRGNATRVVETRIDGNGLGVTVAPEITRSIVSRNDGSDPIRVSGTGTVIANNTLGGAGIELAAASADTVVYANEVSLGTITVASGGNLLLENRVTGGSRGIWVRDADHNRLLANDASGTTGTGILLDGSDDATVRDNVANDNAEHGVRLAGASDNVVENNTANDNAGSGLVVGTLGSSSPPSRNNTFANNTASGNGVHGFAFDVSAETLALETNTALANARDGIHANGSHAVTLRGNDASDNGKVGVNVTNVTAPLLDGNVVVNNTQGGTGGGGIVVLDAPGAALSDNEVRNNAPFGIRVASSDGTVVLDNEIAFNGGPRAGLGLTGGSGDALVEGNNISRNSGYGIEVDDGGPNTVLQGNEITGNGETGIFARAVGNDTLVRNNALADNGGTTSGIRLSIRSAARNQTIENNWILGGGGDGISVAVGAGLPVAGLTVSDNDIQGTADGVRLTTDTGATLSATVRDNAITDGSDSGVALAGAGRDIDVTVRRNDLERNRDGVLLTADVPVTGVDIERNNIVSNDRYGVYNRNLTDETWVDARGNWWGSADGPSSNTGATGVSGPLADPVTGTLADGAGDNVSPMDTTAPYNDTSNVRFDAFLTERFAAETPTATDSTTGGGSSGGGGGGSSATDDGQGDDHSVRLVSASLSDSNVAPGDSVAVTAVVRNDRASSARFTVILSVDGGRVDSRTITVPAKSDRSLSITRRFTDEGRYVVDANGVDAGTLVVGDSSTPEPNETPVSTASEASTATPEPTATATGAEAATATPGDGGPGLGLLLVALLVLLALLCGYYVYRQQDDPVGNPPGE